MTREEEIKERLDKATPSPWVATEGPVRCPLCDGEGDVDALTLDATGPWATTVQVYGIGTDFKDHETFLHHAPDDIRYLLARNEGLKRRVEKMERVVELAKRIYTENEAKEIIGLGIDLLNALNAVDADLLVPEEIEIKAEVENG